MLLYLLLSIFNFGEEGMKLKLEHSPGCVVVQRISQLRGPLVLLDSAASQLPKQL